MKITAVLTVKNEGAFLLEWLAHHRACGITDFLVFSNDCEDGTDEMLDRLAELGWLTHVRNPGPHDEGPQWAALKQADRHPLVRTADWLIVLDIDEFINVHAGDRTIPALLAALPQATAIPLTWRLFGNAGVVATDGTVTETFTRAAPAVLHWPWRAAMFKTLFRNDGCYGKLGVHRPRAANPDRLDGACWFDGSGRRLPAEYRTGRVYSAFGQDNYRLAQLNHYALGSIEDYLLKCDRGRPNREGSVMGMDYWIDRNFCDVEDRSILSLNSSGLRSALMQDSVLGGLHGAALSWRRQRVRALLTEEPWRALYGRLLMAPPSRVLPKEVADAIRKAANGARATGG
ncbi:MULTISPECIES: glycosyltransferase family 2 protein [Tabrizicola]|uniref:glycosyltransferase family 2 protein n=1 Tax=Tabrizicola TaxID=1443919 RepID=UPI0010804991|nr:MULTISPECIES: glycosyltransferase family 2 protein [Paracoccaceae]